MSILHPQIVQLGNRRYRKNTSNHGYQETVNSNELAPYVEETPDMYSENAYENDEPSCQVEEFKGFKPLDKIYLS